MPTFKTEFAGNPNSGITKMNKQKFCTLLDSSAEVSFIHTRVCNSLKDKPRLNELSAFLQSVRGDSNDVDGCTSLKYEIGREKQEYEVFVVQEMKRNIILGRDWLEQFGFCMFYDLGCIGMAQSYDKMEEHIHISSLARLTAHTMIRLQTGKFCLCISKGNKKLLNSKFHHAITTEDGTISRESGLLTDNDIVKTSKQSKFPVFLINNTNKHIWPRKGSTIGIIEEVKECNFVSVDDLNQWEQQTFPKVSSLDDLKQKTILPINHRETV